MQLNKDNALIFSDLHLTLDLVKTNSEGISHIPLLEKIYGFLEEHNPEYFFLLGDTFHSKDTVSASLLYMFRLFLEKVSQLKIKTIIIVGNHDYSFIETRFVNDEITQIGLNPLIQFKDIPNIKIVEDYYRLDNDNVFVAYARTKELFFQRLNKVLPAKRLFCHIDLNGFDLGDDYVEKHAVLDPEDFDGIIKEIYSGHYHEAQEKIIKGIYFKYIGTQQTVNHGESDQEKRFIKLNIKNGEYLSIATGLTLHKTIKINAENESITEEISEKLLRKDVNYRVVITGTKEQCDLSTANLPKEIKSKISPSYIVNTQKRIDLKATDSRFDILEKYAKEEIIRNYGGQDQTIFDMDKLIEVGKNYLSQISSSSSLLISNDKNPNYMIFENFYAENLYSFKEIKINFNDYKDGTTIILGKNPLMDSDNGAGKSNLFRAIFLVIFGKDLKNAAIKKVINENADYFIGILNFSQGNDKYTIVRTENYTGKKSLFNTPIPKSGVLFFINGVGFNKKVDKEKSMSQAMILSKIGITPTIFKNSVLTEQNKKDSFFTTEDSKRKDLLSEIFDLDYYDNASKIVSEDIKDNLKKLEKNKARILFLDDQIISKNKKFEDFRIALAKLQIEATDRQNTLDSSKITLESEINTLKKETNNFKRKDSEKISKDLQTFKSKEKALSTNIMHEQKIIADKATKEEQKKQNEKSITESEQRIQELKIKENEYSKLADEITIDSNESLNQELNILEFKIQKKNYILNKIEKYKQDMKDLNSNIQSNQKQITTSNEHLIKINSEVDFIIHQNACSECKRIFLETESEINNSIIKTKKDAILELKINIEKYSKSITMNEKQRFFIEKRIEKLNFLISKNSFIDESYSELSKKIAIIESRKKLKDSYIKEKTNARTSIIKLNDKILEIIESNKNISDFIEKASLILKQIEKYKTNLDIVKKNIDILTQKESNIINEMALQKSKLELLNEKEKKLIDITKELKDIYEKPAIYQNLIVQTNDELKDHNLELSTKKKEIDLIESHLKYAHFWETGFSKTGIRSFILDDVIIQINEKVKEYLDILSNNTLSVTFESESINQKGVTSNKISTKIYNNGKEKDEEFTSGGESQRIILAVDLAISEIAEIRSGTRFNIKFIDEPFKGLCTKGESRAIQLFNKLAEFKHGFFIITHNKEIQSSNFNNAIYILKQDDISNIVKKEVFLNA